MNAPQRIHVITKAAAYGEEQEPVAIKINGKYVDWSDALVQQLGNLHDLIVDGHPYRWVRKYGERMQDGLLYLGHAYRLQVGYNVLTSYKLPNVDESGYSPLFKHPVFDRAEAELEARKLVTKNLSAYSTRVIAQIVPQNGEEFGEPVATISGHNHERHEAARAFLRQEWLPLDWTNDEAGDAPTSPAPRSSSSSTEEQEPTQEHDTTDGQESQEIVLTVQYKGTGAAITPTGSYPGATCKLVNYTDDRNNRPPDENVARLRRWLNRMGYEPHYPGWTWLGKKGQTPRHRLEPYRRNGNGAPAHVDHSAWATLSPPTQESGSETERLALYKTKALVGEGPFAPCRDCPQVHDCPHGWGACDRKAEFARARQVGKSRYQLFVPGLIG